MEKEPLPKRKIGKYYERLSRGLSVPDPPMPQDFGIGPPDRSLYTKKDLRFGDRDPSPKPKRRNALIQIRRFGR